MAAPGGKTKAPVQMEFFTKAYKLISNKETERGLKAIVTECIRLGVPKETVNKIVRLLGVDNEAVKVAAKALDSGS